ncbi:hypothetical protein [Variovorax sp. OV329]|uniref:hypothetical protein n=1 Tax=Variovorax sp. OV329 TaxID=1882825 RepID=UPI0008E07DCC|nr:hypothetical protein [Variovorax sp. OV329]SFL87350.1 hypothetical protein SAMN05444747_10170 [Variovorax sp. OV329]
MPDTKPQPFAQSIPGPTLGQLLRAALNAKAPSPPPANHAVAASKAGATLATAMRGSS